MLNWNFTVIMKQTTIQTMLFYFEIFKQNSKTALCPLRRTRKMLLTLSIVYTKGSKLIELVALCCKEFWLVQENHATVKIDSSVTSREWKLTAKAELNCKICQSSRKWWKSRNSFCHQSSYLVKRKAWALALNIAGAQNYTRKTFSCSECQSPFDWSFKWKVCL